MLCTRAHLVRTQQLVPTVATNYASRYCSTVARHQFILYFNFHNEISIVPCLKDFIKGFCSTKKNVDVEYYSFIIIGQLRKIKDM